MEIKIYRTQKDSIGDTTGMTDDEIEAACNEIDNKVADYLRKWYPGANVWVSPDQSLREFEAWDDDGNDIRDDESAVIRHLMADVFSDWCATF